MKEEIARLMDLAQKEIDRDDIMMGFYKNESIGKGKEDTAKLKMKVDQIKTSKEFNERLLKYLKTL